ncbi:MAG: 16S rRNA (cytosine(1402)-N(4))-methyltransferase RsmH [Chloroherpetonaceae bacterium]|nr:16S rRNA (cytosine(1402)-N(4))-methyltransferase RsmH [Chloroherpetonaceae bacterium]
MTAFQHLPVLLRESVAGLVTQAGIYIDGTLGGGGHSEGLLEALQANGWLERSLVIGIDRDREALAAASARLLPKFSGHFRAVEHNFAELDTVFYDLVGPSQAAQGVLLDLGVSSHQLNTAERGFSFQKSGPLNMRMSATQVLTAKAVVNHYSEAELLRVLRKYGEEPAARKIVRQIVAARRTAPIETTDALAALVRAAVPASPLAQTKTLARVFQALRIEVNQELQALEQALGAAHKILAPKGRLAVIAYHSLEDRLVKQFMRTHSRDDWGEKGMPLTAPIRAATLRLITKKPIVPTAAEIAANTRARSAKLRIAEKL